MTHRAGLCEDRLILHPAQQKLSLQPLLIPWLLSKCFNPGKWPCLLLFLPLSQFLSSSLHFQPSLGHKGFSVFTIIWILSFIFLYHCSMFKFSLFFTVFFPTFIPKSTKSKILLSIHPPYKSRIISNYLIIIFPVIYSFLITYSKYCILCFGFTCIIFSLN